MSGAVSRTLKGSCVPLSGTLPVAFVRADPRGLKRLAHDRRTRARGPRLEPLLRTPVRLVENRPPCSGRDAVDVLVAGGLVAGLHDGDGEHLIVEPSDQLLGVPVV